MSTKTDILYDQIFSKYITGEYGDPIIPSDSAIYTIIDSLNIDDSKPLMDLNGFNTFTFDKMNKIFTTMIDDLDLLYHAINTQSLNINNQLTNSLLEYRGVKQSLNIIKQDAIDINSGKTDLDNIRYVYTEAFNNCDNININSSTIDTNTMYPVIDINAGAMYIPDDSKSLIDFNHYYGKRLNFLPSNYNGNILETKFIGNSDVASILDVNNDDRLIYQLITSDPTAIHISFILQLDSNNLEMDINSIVLNVDSKLTHGYIRIEYKVSTGWSSLPDIPTKSIDSDNIILSFNNIMTSHIKLTFIKEVPDVDDANIYYISINNLSVFKSYNSKSSILISNSTQIKPYSIEKLIIGTIAAELDGYLPEDCYANVYVANEKLVPAFFVNKLGQYVSPESLNKYKLIKADDSIPTDKYISLSDIIANPNISGVSDFNHLVYDWKILKSFKSDNMKPEMIDFIDLHNKNKYDNSISNILNYKFGDEYYRMILNGTYPQSDYPYGTLQSGVFMSGIVDDTNTSWIPLMQDLVNINPMLSGVDYGSDIQGFPFNWYNNSTYKTLFFNDYINLIPGWYRTNSDLVTSSGIVDSLGNKDVSTIQNIEDPFPDFYINGLKFYKIYRFKENSNIVTSNISLYNYQTKPINGTDNDYYPHNLVWKYNDSKIPIRNTQIDYPIDIYNQPSSSGIITLNIPNGGEYIKGSIRDVHYDEHHLYFTKNQDYIINETDIDSITIDFKKLGNNDIIADDPTTKIKFNYAYNQFDKYASYWKGFIIVDEPSKIIIKQSYVITPTSEEKVVNKYKIYNIKTQEYITKNDNEAYLNYYKLNDNEKTIELNRGIYEIIIHCLTDVNGAHPANWWSPNSSEFIQVIGNAKLVANVNPLKNVSLETLLYTSTYENDSRCSVITDVDGLQYVIVKAPSKNIIPGYYFDNTYNSYIKQSDQMIKNIGHYHRSYLTESGINSFITGSNNDSIVSGYYFDDTAYIIDESWNLGKPYPQDFINTNSGLYPEHSTFGEKINIDYDYDSSNNNKGHLFYNTAENLPSFYTITYGIVDKSDISLDKFLYKIELISEHDYLTPYVNNIKFTINTNLEEL